MQFEIFSIKDIPEYLERGVDWFSSKWSVDRNEYFKSFYDCLNKEGSLPQWYLALDKGREIVGGCGLIDNDFVDRTDLSPYLCALFVEPHVRGHALGSQLLARARLDGAKLRFSALYLCTDHTSYYEKYGWEYIGIGEHPQGGTSRIYRADTIKCAHENNVKHAAVNPVGFVAERELK